MNGRAVNPYHVLLSEAMLQQTQVATVIPYFHRFIEAFPTVADLANADEQHVLTLWQGLGYYRRARNLHAAAKVIVADYAEQIPSTVAELRKLPGVGPYTAGAIASIAHGTQAALVDGNVERVFARLMLIEQPINAPATKKEIWTLAQELVPKANPGDYNQALMELGAMVCTPKVPKCFVCPVREHCRGVHETNPERLPVKLAKKKPKDVTHVVIAAQRNGKYLFEQRPSDGLWSNMWQMPTWEECPDSGSPQGHVPGPKKASQNERIAIPATANDPFIAWVRKRYGLEVRKIDPITEFVHQTTHRTIRFVVLRAEVTAGRLKPRAGVWRRLDALGTMPMSNPQRKAIEHLG